MRGPHPVPRLRIEIDSNTVERSIRPIALSRKNALFAGSDGGGEDWGGRRPAGRNLQAQRRRSSRLSRRRACQDRQGPSQQPDRRSPAMGYVKAEPLKARGLKTPRTVLRADGGRANERQSKAQPTIRRAIDRTRLAGNPANANSFTSGRVRAIVRGGAVHSQGCKYREGRREPILRVGVLARLPRCARRCLGLCRGAGVRARQLSGNIGARRIGDILESLLKRARVAIRVVVGPARLRGRRPDHSRRLAACASLLDWNPFHWPICLMFGTSRGHWLQRIAQNRSNRPGSVKIAHFSYSASLDLFSSALYLGTGAWLYFILRASA